MRSSCGDGTFALTSNRKESVVLPLTNRSRDRIVDREVMKLRLRDASRHTAADKRPYGDKLAPQPQRRARVG